ncbi:MAG: cobaltochelatase CobT-related protein, partial [Acidimicrobiales bacterium]
MNVAAGDLRHRQQVEELCASVIRALSGEPDVYYRRHRLHRGGTPLHLRAPHLHPSHESDDFGSFRGVADGVALRLLHCDTDLHERLCPRDSVAHLVFELLEQLRVETLGDSSMPGVTANLNHRHREWSLALHRSGLTETARGLL